MPWQNVFIDGFGPITTPEWVLYTGTGTPGGNLARGTDGTTTAAIATTYQVAEYPLTYPFDLTTLYKVAVMARTAKAPTTGTANMYVGVSGFAGSQRINTTGVNSIGGQAYTAVRGTAPPATYTEYIGYIYGRVALNSPADSGPSPDINNPQRMWFTVNGLRPLMYFLYDSTTTDGLQYVDTYWLQKLAFANTISATYTPNPSTTWTVTLRLATDGVYTSEYTAYRITRADGTDVTFVQGAVPSTATTTQKIATSDTYYLSLWRQLHGAWQRISPFVSTVVTLPGGTPGAVLSVQGASASAEILTWDKFDYARTTSTIPVAGTTEPVVLSSRAYQPTTELELLTRTTPARTALLNVLNAVGPVYIAPACASVAPTLLMVTSHSTERWSSTDAADFKWRTTVRGQVVTKNPSALAAPLSIDEEAIPS